MSGMIDQIVAQGLRKGSWGFAEFTESGEFVVPAGVHLVFVDMCGAGAGGAGGHASAGGGGGGGAGASIRMYPLHVIPGETLTFTIDPTVPAGGGVGEAGSPGGSTRVYRGGTQIMYASGSSGTLPQPGTGTVGGAGGTGSANSNTALHGGAAGASGQSAAVDNFYNGTLVRGTGGGGGGAPAAAAGHGGGAHPFLAAALGGGNNGGGGGGSSWFGDGGAGGATGVSGANATGYGGGGGGGGVNAAGGNGGRGLVRFYWP